MVKKMIPGMNSRQMKQMMRKMGVQQQEYDASQVIIKTPEGDIIIDEPNVSKVNMMGQETWQIVGESRLEERDSTPDVSEDDVNTVVDQTGCSPEIAKEKILEHKGDLAEAIIELSNTE